jgi:hypothetical protein
MLAHGNQAGRQGHHRLAAKIFPGGAIVQRRHAIQDNARAHPVKMRLRPQQNAAGCGDRAQPRLAFGKGGEDIQLAFGGAAVGSSARAKWLTIFTGWRTFLHWLRR